MLNNLEEIKDRSGEHLNRKKITIISQNSNEIIADIERADDASEQGTPINKKLINGLIKEVNDIKTYYGDKFGTTLYKGEETFSRYDLDLLAKKVDVDNLNNIKADKTELPIGLPIGSIISSTIPLNDASFHLLDGSTISQTGIYAEFCTYLKNIAQTNSNILCTQSDFDEDVNTTGNCGKFVIDDNNGTIRLPKITRFIQGLTELNQIGTSLIDEFKSHTHLQQPHNHYDTRVSNGTRGAGSYTRACEYNIDSRTGDTTAINLPTGGAETRPKATQYPYYIVLATSVKTNVQVNLDNVASDINNISNQVSNASSILQTKKMQLIFSGQLRGGGNTVKLNNPFDYDFLMIWAITDAGEHNMIGFMPCKDRPNNFGTISTNIPNGGRLFCRYALNDDGVFSCNNMGYDTTYRNNVDGWYISRIWGCKL